MWKDLVSSWSRSGVAREPHAAADAINCGFLCSEYNKN